MFFGFPVSQVIPVIPVSQVIPVIPVITVCPVSPVSPVTLTQFSSVYLPHCYVETPEHVLKIVRVFFCYIPRIGTFFKSRL